MNSPSCIDPHTGKPLMDRTVLMANTSNMPVAAREASIYTGMTIAEYYRDMGYHVAIMADSTSRWAEALREISGRLEEMPAEEGFPAYLPSAPGGVLRARRIYEDTLSGRRRQRDRHRRGLAHRAATFPSPSPRTPSALSARSGRWIEALAYARHFPAINWNTSYSEYLTDLAPWYVAALRRGLYDPSWPSPGGDEGGDQPQRDRQAHWFGHSPRGSEADH